MAYMIAEFTDRLGTSNSRKNGKIWFVGRPDQEDIDACGLTESKNGMSGMISWHTTLKEMAARGWTLKFVTPCAVNLGAGPNYNGPVENAYIFVKDE